MLYTQSTRLLYAKAFFGSWLKTKWIYKTRYVRTCVVSLHLSTCPLRILLETSLKAFPETLHEVRGNKCIPKFLLLGFFIYFTQTEMRTF